MAAMLENIRYAITCLPIDRLCHSRCLATAHWTFSSYGHLKAERVN